MATRWLKCKKCGYAEPYSVNAEIESCYHCAQGIKVSEVIEVLQKSLEEYGDFPVKHKFSYANVVDVHKVTIECEKQKNDPYFILDIK